MLLLGIVAAFPVTRLVRFSRFFTALLAVIAADTFCPQLFAEELPLPPRIVVNTVEEALKLAGPDLYPVKGTGSMKPYIPESDDPDKVVAILAVDKPPYEDLKKGDLVIFRADGSQVVHQIAAAQGEKWITSGIDNQHYDGPALDRETFVGRVLRVYVLGSAVPTDKDEKSKSATADKKIEVKKNAENTPPKTATP